MAKEDINIKDPDRPAKIMSDGFLYRAFRSVLALCAVNLPITGEFSWRRANNVYPDVTLLWVRLNC